MNKRPQPFNRRHTAGRILNYVFAGYKFRFFLVLLCILVSAIAAVGGSLFLQALIDDYIAPLLAMETPVYTALLQALLMMACLYVTGACAPWPTTGLWWPSPGRTEDHPATICSATCRPCPSSTLPPTPTAT